MSMIPIILSVQLPKTYYKALKYLGKAHTIGTWFCVAVIALVLIISFALLYGQSHSKNSANKRRIKAGVIFLLVFTFCWFGFSEHNYVNAYQSNLRQTMTYTRKQIKNTRNQKDENILKSRNHRYTEWLKLTHF